MNLLSSPRFEELKTTGQLPSPTGVAQQVMKLGRKEDVAASEIVRVIKADPALAARLVKAANKGVVLGRRPIASVPDAVLVLGLRAVRQLALGFSLLSSHRHGKCRSFDYARFWQHSLGTAIAFGALATRVKTAPAEEAFVAGLLSGMGSLALATLYPREYSDVIDQFQRDSSTPLAALERAAFALDHNELTAALLCDWGLPRAIVDAAYHQEMPDQCGSPPDTRAHLTARALHYARRLGELCLARDEERAALYPALRELGTQFGLDGDATLVLLDEIASEWQDWGRILDVDSSEVPLIADAASGGVRESAVAVPARMPEEPSPAQKLRVLLVDDDPAVLMHLKNALASAGHFVTTASNGREGLDAALDMKPHVIITDWMMPEMDGVSMCRSLRQAAVGRSIYIVVLTSFQDVNRLVEAFEAGADDYLRKPVSARVLMARLRAGQRVVQVHDELQHDREEMRRFAADLAIANRRFQEAALTDALTGFPNRRYAMERVEQEWATAQRSGRPFACLLVDVDHFKQVNDTYGHDTGDKVLKHIAKVLKESARTPDTIGRLGGEEFLVVCPDTNAFGAEACAERLRAAVERVRFPMGHLSLPVTVSVGVAVWTRSTPSCEALIKVADQALYAAKEAGRNRTCFLDRYPEA
jgi:diguanylate cyclase (GGDEF)-like protein